MQITACPRLPQRAGRRIADTWRCGCGGVSGGCCCPRHGSFVPLNYRRILAASLYRGRAIYDPPRQLRTAKRAGRKTPVEGRRGEMDRRRRVWWHRCNLCVSSGQTPADTADDEIKIKRSPSLPRRDAPAAGARGTTPDATLRVAPGTGRANTGGGPGDIGFTRTRTATATVGTATECSTSAPRG
jgi:hypothetical protein